MLEKDSSHEYVEPNSEKTINARFFMSQKYFFFYPGLSQHITYILKSMITFIFL